MEGYHRFVKDQWLSLKVEGWGMFVMKEKLKMLKGKLKEWHKPHTKNLEGKIKAAKEELNKMDLKSEIEMLSPTKEN